MSKRTFRSFCPALLPSVAAVLLLGTGTAQAHTVGFQLTKTCPSSVASGASFQCTFSVRNLDVDHGVINLAVTNTVPFPGGTTSPVSCVQGGNPVTSLGPSGPATDTCDGTIDETAPINSGTTSVFFADQVGATGNDADTGQYSGLAISGSVTGGTFVQPQPPHIVGFQITKTCPSSVASGASFQCTFSIRNLDVDHGVINLAVTNTAPFPGGPTSPVSCLQGAFAVTSLGPSGPATDTCAGTIDETAPLNCAATSVFYQDRVQAAGNDADTGQYSGLPVSGSTTNATQVQPVACTVATPAGNDVLVSVGNVTATFSNVAGGGTTTVNPIDPASAGGLPGGYSVSNLGIAYEISTTASASGDIVIGIVVPNSVDEVTFNSLRLLHGEGGVLVDRTYFSPDGCAPAPDAPCPAPDFATRTIYAQVQSLSPFVLATVETPSIGPITVPTDPVAVGTLVNVSASFTDLGTHTAVWSWDDGTTSPGAVTESGGMGTVTGSHAYTAAGVYRVTLGVTDSGGNTGQRTSAFIVVYDPNGGFVTGGGWINSPAGAYAADAELAGKATFGFVSKYPKGANLPPAGETQFQFSVADFKFESTAYEWMIISGAKARYRGTGKINGSGSYGFELTAWDGQISGGGNVDRFRIKIWDSNQGNGVVYDNQMGAADGADPTTSLGGGSIVIHKK